MTEQLMVIGRTVWGPKVPTMKGTEASLSYVHCPVFLVTCIFFSKCHYFSYYMAGYILDRLRCICHFWYWLTNTSQDMTIHTLLHLLCKHRGPWSPKAVGFLISTCVRIPWWLGISIWIPTLHVKERSYSCGWDTEIWRILCQSITLLKTEISNLKRNNC